MKKKIFLLLFCVLIAFLVSEGMASAKTWYVDDDFAEYPTADFSSIQDAIDAADPGDIVYVYNGTYYENVIINKPLKLTGESMESIICGAWYGNCVKIMSSNVSVDGFTIKYSGSDDAGIYVASNNNTIANNTLIENGYGIKLIEDNNTIMNNVITNNSDSDGTGIYVSANNNTIANNTVIENICGIELNGDNNIIMGSLIVNNSNDIYFKGDLNDVINNTIWNIDLHFHSRHNNIISNNINEEITITDSDYNLISNNFVNESINLGRSKYNKIISNNINKEVNINNPNSDYNLISNNYVNERINLHRSDHNKITNNTIKLSINLEDSKYNRLVAN